jgi:hypothetical protein
MADTVTSHDHSSAAARSTREAKNPRWGLMAGFSDPKQFMAAVEKTRDAGYQKWDCHTPFPMHGLSNAMGLKWSRLPWVVMGFGAAGTGTALLMQWWMNAVDYQLIVSGKPFFSVPANIPVTFELTVLFAAISTFIGMLVANGLPALYHPTLKSDSFRAATSDRFFIVIEAADPRFDAVKTREFLAAHPGAVVEELED